MVENNIREITKVTFPVTSFRKIESPYGEINKTDGEKEIKTYVTIVNVKDIPTIFSDWRNINVRYANEKNATSKIIRESLRDAPEKFYLKNRGLTLIVDSATFNNKNNLLSLELTDIDLHGLLDGGHTFQAIQTFLEDLNKEELDDFDAYVKVEILEGIDDKDETVAIVGARNKSTPVKENSLEDLLGRYDSLKNVLNDQSYKKRISYKEYEIDDEGNKKDIDIKEILSYLICFDVENFDNQNHPTRAYTSKASVVDYIKKQDDERMKKYIPVLPVILELKDTIQLKLPNAYNKSGGKFGSLKGVMLLSGKKRYKSEELYFIDKSSDYRIPSGFIYPILAAFRNLVECADEKCSWKIDPIKFLPDVIDELALRVGDQALELKNPNKLGKDKATWRGCYDTVELEVLRRSL